MIIATCATLAALLAQAKGGETIRLTTSCQNVTVTRTYPTAVTVIADGATVQALVIRGGNLVWRGGILSAVGGVHASGPTGYAASLTNAKNVTFDNVTFTGARKGIVVNGASVLVVNNSRFTRLGDDGIVLYNADRANITGNRFSETVGKPSSCALPAGAVSGIKLSDCEKRGGTWLDGYHPDAVQIRQSTRLLIAGNTVTGPTQGIGQMDAVTDGPLRNVEVERNTVAVTFPHTITLGAKCVDCRIRFNEVRRGAGSTSKTVIRPGAALACGNKVQDVQDGTAACKA